MSREPFEVCESCHRLLDPKLAVWLELDQRDNTWHGEGDPVPAEHTQGGFPFGASCAKATLRRVK